MCRARASALGPEHAAELGLGGRVAVLAALDARHRRRGAVEARPVGRARDLAVVLEVHVADAPLVRAREGAVRLAKVPAHERVVGREGVPARRRRHRLRGRTRDEHGAELAGGLVVHGHDGAHGAADPGHAGLGLEVLDPVRAHALDAGALVVEVRGRGLGREGHLLGLRRRVDDDVRAHGLRERPRGVTDVALAEAEREVRFPAEPGDPVADVVAERDHLLERDGWLAEDGQPVAAELAARGVVEGRAVVL
mmetsp:Transcript_28127/g.84287  ORF Transcript_28127/g.84287 Transcript_28127/m.84287 type:complete len:252 (+) Transcript_28127:113-868(+)